MTEPVLRHHSVSHLISTGSSSFSLSLSDSTIVSLGLFLRSFLRSALRFSTPSFNDLPILPTYSLYSIVSEIVCPRIRARVHVATRRLLLNKRSTPAPVA